MAAGSRSRPARGWDRRSTTTSRPIRCRWGARTSRYSWIEHSIYSCPRRSAHGDRQARRRTAPHAGLGGARRTLYARAGVTPDSGDRVPRPQPSRRSLPDPGTVASAGFRLRRAALGIRIRRAFLAAARHPRRADVAGQFFGRRPDRLSGLRPSEPGRPRRGYHPLRLWLGPESSGILGRRDRRFAAAAVARRRLFRSAELERMRRRADPGDRVLPRRSRLSPRRRRAIPAAIAAGRGAAWRGVLSAPATRAGDRGPPALVDFRWTALE